MSQFLHDTFTDTDQTNLENHSAEVGGAWSKSASYSGSVVRIYNDGTTSRAYTSANWGVFVSAATPGGTAGRYVIQAVIRYKSSAGNEFGFTICDANGEPRYEARIFATGVLRLYRLWTAVGDPYTITWSPDTDYTIEMDTLTTPGTIYIRVDGVTRITYVDADFQVGTTIGWYSNVGVTNTTGQHLDSMDAYDAPIAPPPPPTPTDLTVGTITSSSIALSWAQADPQPDGWTLQYDWVGNSFASPVTVDVPAETASVDIGSLASSTEYEFRVRSYLIDPGTNYSEWSDTDSGTTSQNTPTATITTPADGQKFNNKHNATFTGTGTDSEDGALMGALLVWSSNVDGEIGTGTSVTTATLTPGAHTITLTATDSSAATGTDTVGITITRGAGPLNSPFRF